MATYQIIDYRTSEHQMAKVLIKRDTHFENQANGSFSVWSILTATSIMSAFDIASMRNASLQQLQSCASQGKSWISVIYGCQCISVLQAQTVVKTLYLSEAGEPT